MYAGVLDQTPEKNLTLRRDELHGGNACSELHCECSVDSCGANGVGIQ